MNSLLLLHGAIGSSSQLASLKIEFERQFSEVLLFDFPGHGGKEFSGIEFSIKLFSESVLKFLDENKIDAIDIFGYSMGGYVALYLARHYPQRVGKIFTLGTKLEWNPEISVKEVKMLDPEKISLKVPAFAESLGKRHAPLDWKINLKKTAQMMITLGENPELKKEDFGKINHEILLSIGDRDNMVTKEETMEVYGLLPNGLIEIINNTPHPIEQVDVRKIAAMANDFF